jgi:signal transduction histidine kinase
MPRLPIRWRLMVWFTAVMAVVVLVVGAGLYLVLRMRLYGNFDEQLADQAALTLALVRTDTGTPELAMTGIAGVPVDSVVRLVDARGTAIVDTAEQTDGLAVASLEDEIGSALDGETRYSVHPIEDGETLRMVSVPVRRDPGGEVAGVLQIGRDRAEIDEPLAELRRLLVLALPVMLAATATGGYLLAARALAPVEEIAGLAARVDAGALHERLDLDLPDDELGRLARTFDGMLFRIEDAFERQRRFTADAAHELRTPLAMMRSEIDLALHRPRTSEEYRHALRSLEGDVERLTLLVTRLLTLARADAGAVVVQRSAVDLAAIVHVVLDQYRESAEHAGLTLVDESAPAMATAMKSG